MNLTHRLHFIQIVFFSTLKVISGIDWQNLTFSLCFNRILHFTHPTNLIIFVQMKLLQWRKLYHSAPCWYKCCNCWWWRVGLKICTCFIHFWKRSVCGDTDEAFRDCCSSMTTHIYTTRNATWIVSRLNFERLRHYSVVWNASWFSFLLCICNSWTRFALLSSVNTLLCVLRADGGPVYLAQLEVEDL